MRTRTIIYFVFFLCLFCIEKLSAQFDSQWSQYTFNPGVYNPGAVGLNSDLNVHLAFREQWVGFTNAPSAFNVHVGAPLRTGNQISGIGLLMTNESIGLFQSQFFQLQYAYKKKLWNGELSIGVQGGILQQNFASGDIYIPQSDYHSKNDEAIPKGDIEGMIPDFSIGLWYSKPLWYAGLSCSHLVGGEIKLNEKESASESDAAQFKLSRSIYLTGGYNIPLKNPLYTLRPSFLLKSDLVVLQADLSTLLHYKNYWGGLSWRPSDALAVIIGTQFDFGLSIGYSYDIPISRYLQFSNGSHELFIGYRKKIDTARINKQQKSIRIL